MNEHSPSELSFAVSRTVLTGLDFFFSFFEAGFVERSKPEEFVNTSTHGIGILLVLVGAVVLLCSLSDEAGIRIWLACIVYLLTLLSVYVCSTLSHYYSSLERKALFRQLDQACIYLLIVGSYTPFSVEYLHGLWWSSLLGLMWTIAIVGAISKVFFAHRIQRVSIWLYLALGWLPAMGGVMNTDSLTRECLLWIVGGGVTYSLGTIFLFNDRKARYLHAVWHLFVIAGSVIHFLGIMKCVVH